MLGATLAILCAFTWSSSVILFRKTGADVHPVVLNLVKNSLAALLLVPTVALCESLVPTGVAPRDVALMLVSGVIGIGLADAMLLKALQEIGATRLAIVECTYSPFVILLSTLFLGESFLGSKLVGGALVLAALICVSLGDGRGADGRRDWLAGGCWAVAAIFAMAAGIVMIKPLFARVPLFYLIGVRLVGGLAMSMALFSAMKRRRAAVAALRRVERKGLLILTCVLSTYVSMMLWVAGYKYNDAGVTAVLNQTSTIFTVVMASVFLRERFTPARAAGTVLAVSGVVLLTLG